jgi:hypothetical protein
MSKSITNQRMDAFCTEIVRQLRELITLRSPDILHAWQENILEAQNNEDKFPPLKLSISATVDLDSAKIETMLAFTARYKTTFSSPLPDPNQPELTGLEDAMHPSHTIEISGDIIDVSAKGITKRKNAT